MRNRLRKRLAALALSGVMLFSGSILTLAQSPAGEISEDKITWGVMIETPSAALISDRLAQYVSFFSIGTNDLTQYTLAADRINVATASYYDPLHPAVQKLVEITVGNARKAGIKVSVCGESAADATCAKVYAELGVRCLSMAQNAMIPVKQRLMEVYNGV